jgi:lipoate-protein ligase A
MQHLELTMPTPAENLALDEALLEWAEEENGEREVLRMWESPEPMVVVGRSSRVTKEVNESACSERQIPILRRSSGGAAIVAGPGCVMYALVLSLEARPELKDIGRAHKFILGRLADSLGPLVTDAGTICCKGTSDLVLCDRTSPATALKFSGNSLRVKRTHLLYHGTLLYDFDVSLIETCLRMPPRQPDYRKARPHHDFVMNLPVSRAQLEQAARAAWPADGVLSNFPMPRVSKLVAERFGNTNWTYEFT